MRYVAFLRGMNLGRRRVKNDELCAIFEEIGFAKVSAFLASGNVIFDTELSDTSAIERQIEAGLESSLGYEVKTFVRSSDEVKRVASREPFAGLPDGNRGRIQVAFLERDPDDAGINTVLELSNDDDRLELNRRELYWMPKGNLSESELDINALERVLGTMTIRTKRTVERIAARFLVA